MGDVRIWSRGEQLGTAAQVALDKFRRDARETQEGFSDRVMRDETGAPMVLGAIHRVMHIHIEACWRARVYAAVLAPFGHGKTGQCIVGRMARELGLDINRRSKIVCANDARALERSQAVRTLIASPRYRMAFPDVCFADPGRKAKKSGQLAKDTGHAFYLRRPGFSLDASVHAVGVLSGGVGGRCDDLYFDDVVDQKNALDNPKLRQKVIDNIEQVWLQRVEPHGRVLLLGTPWHEADAIHHIQRKEAWCVLRVMVSRDLSRLEMEVVNPPADYPLPRAHERKRLKRAA